jgi:hypothetical protein
MPTNLTVSDSKAAPLPRYHIGAAVASANAWDTHTVLCKARSESGSSDLPVTRTAFNPLYWLGILVVWTLRLPFKLLGAAGFNATKVEESFFGKILKLIWGLGLGFATFIPAILETADHWDKIRPLLHKWLAALRL